MNKILPDKYISREIKIGDLSLGGQNPIRLQSMTNTPTQDIEATVNQCIRIIEAGADLVRITTPTTIDANNLVNIKNELRKKGYKTPLVADVHFNADVAEVAAEIVEKVRINPGNFAARRWPSGIISDADYAEELEKVHARLLRLLAICKKNGTALRIGVNHGSLSDRIMSRYGDTPQGMVESAMEFIRICAQENFHNLVISLKASNTRVMVQAYRLLVFTMLNEGYNYPLHLGVTEAGDGEDGRIRSAIGIGSLLIDGIGDTIRVSLTEEPELEIPVARQLVKHFSCLKNKSLNFLKNDIKNPFEYSRRETIAISNIGKNNVPIVIADYDTQLFNNKNIIKEPDYIYITDASQLKSDLNPKFQYIINLHDWYLYARELPNVFPLYTAAEFDFYEIKHDQLNFVILSTDEFTNNIREMLEKYPDKVVLIIETFSREGINEQRSFFYKLLESGFRHPVIINRNYSEDDTNSLAIKAACDTGIMLIDGFGDGLWLRNVGKISADNLLNIAFSILQFSRVRSIKTEYISCPSCGRTLFDLMTTTARVKEATSHLSHLKIAIMGCIVNGPGEMADADYGYVGAAPGKITLYKGKQVIKKNIPTDQAVNELINLIKENGDWIDPPLKS